MTGHFFAYIKKYWQTVFNSWAVCIWLAGAFIYASFCCLKWDEWIVREQFGMTCFEPVLTLGAAYLLLLPVIVGWIWHRALIRHVLEMK